MKISDVNTDITAQVIQQYQRNDNNAANSDKQAITTAARPEEKVGLSKKDFHLLKSFLSPSRNGRCNS
jgi:hypothetical protein